MQTGQVVLRGLGLGGRADRLLQRRAVQSPQREFRRGVQTGLQLPVRRDADAVAPVAEAAAHRADQPHRAGIARHAVQLRHAVAADHFQLRHGGKHGLCRQKALLWPLRAHPHGHEFDEAHAVVLFLRQRDKIADLIVVHAAEEHDVELGVGKTRLTSGIQAALHVAKRAPPRDGGKTLGPQRVHADVQPVHAGVFELPRHGGQKAAVGRQCQLLQPLDAAQHAAQRHDPRPQQRLSAGEADLFYAAAHRRLRDLGKLLQAEDVAVGLFAHALLAHAVHAAVVAKIRHGQAQIFDFPSDAVFHIFSFTPRRR